MRELRAYLQQGKPLLFDGAMGTLFGALPAHTEQACEQANLTDPEAITSIHRAYLEAGCMAIRTNTFALSQRFGGAEEGTVQGLVDAACALALRAAEPYGAWVFGELGPAPQDGPVPPQEAYIRQADRFLSNGIRHFFIGTLASDAGVEALCRHIKARCADSFLIVSYAVDSDGMTHDGVSGRTLFAATAALPSVDAVGFNCACGPHHLLQLISALPRGGAVLSAMPNAGYPTVLGRRMIFKSDAAYYAEKLREIASAGAAIVGGCCGTTPAHIAACARALSGAGASAAGVRLQPAQAPDTPRRNVLAEKLGSGKRVIAVELDPPTDDRAQSFLQGVAELKEAGVDAITVSDCPIGRPRADSSLLACKIKRELEIEPLPHLTCRDRNLNATKALLLGLSMEDIHNVLLVTGDPIPTEYRDEVKGVFNFNSQKLIRYVADLNAHSLRTPFCIYAALNLNAPNFEVQLRHAVQKEESGVRCFLTQPILSEEAFANLKRARETLGAKILGGIFPLVSYKNACFLSNEMSGMRISEEILSLYRDKDRAAAETVAVDLSVRVARRIEPYTDGLYLMTPFRRIALIKEILSELAHS